MKKNPILCILGLYSIFIIPGTTASALIEKPLCEEICNPEHCEVTEVKSVCKASCTSRPYAAAYKKNCDPVKDQPSAANPALKGKVQSFCNQTIPMMGREKPIGEVLRLNICKGE